MTSGWRLWLRKFWRGKHNVQVLLLFVFGLGCAVLTAWASHLQSGVELEPTGNCDEAEGIAIQSGIDEPLEFPSRLLMGKWNVIDPTNAVISETGVLLSGFRGTIDVHDGLVTYDYSVPSSGGGTCIHHIQITGVPTGSPFVVAGPCLVGIGDRVQYMAKLVDPATGKPEEPDPVTSPVENLVGNPNMQLRVRRFTGGSFQPHRMIWYGDKESGDVVVDGDISKAGFEVVINPTSPLEFIDEGLYEIEMVWRMRMPPDGQVNNLATVSTAKMKVVAGNFATVAASLGMTLSQLAAEICPRGEGCFTCVTVSEGMRVARGMTLCDGKGGFVPMVFRGYIAREANGQGVADADTVVQHLEPCVMAHESRHVRWFKNNKPDACEGVCCDRGPGPRTRRECIQSEKDADLFGGIPCLDSKLPLLTGLTRREREYLELVLADWQDRAHDEDYTQCERLP